MLSVQEYEDRVARTIRNVGSFETGDANEARAYLKDLRAVEKQLRQIKREIGQDVKSQASLKNRPSTGNSDVAEKLNNLQRLLDDGVINHEEYANLRKQVLSSLT